MLLYFYGSLAHGVEKIDPQEKLSWKSNKGRWFLGMFVNDSDHVQNRVTSKDLTGTIKNEILIIDKMAILITGANGLIGSDLVKKLSNKHKIFGIYRTKNDEVKKIKNVIWIKYDLKKNFRKKLKPNPKFIIHCAVAQETSKKKKY